MWAARREGRGRRPHGSDTNPPTGPCSCGRIQPPADSILQAIQAFLPPLLVAVAHFRFGKASLREGQHGSIVPGGESNRHFGGRATPTLPHPVKAEAKTENRKSGMQG